MLNLWNPVVFCRISGRVFLHFYRTTSVSCWVFCGAQAANSFNRYRIATLFSSNTLHQSSQNSQKLDSWTVSSVYIKNKVTDEATIQVQKRELRIRFKGFFFISGKNAEFYQACKQHHNTSWDYFLPINTKLKTCYLLALTLCTLTLILWILAPTSLLILKYFQLLFFCTKDELKPH